MRVRIFLVRECVLVRENVYVHACMCTCLCVFVYVCACVCGCACEYVRVCMWGGREGKIGVGSHARFLWQCGIRGMSSTCT